MGFSYQDWVDNFYPGGLTATGYLAHYATHFDTVEIDSTFYRIPARTTIQKWAGAVGSDFVFSAKFPRTVTHEGGLSTRIASANQFIEIMSGLGKKLGPLLLQFPYGFFPDQFDLLAALLAHLPRETKIAVELRNRKWLNDRLFDLLSNEGIALCLVEHPWVPRLKVQTADFQYIRLLGDRQQIKADFSHVRFERAEELAYWSRSIKDLSEMGGNIFIYVNNHFTGHSPTTAGRLLNLVSNQ